MGKATMSRDHVMRMNLRVQHRVGADDLARLIAKAAANEVDWREEFPLNPSATWILAKARDTLWHYGAASGDYWADDLTDDDRDEIEAWAVPAINGAFPELGIAEI